MSLAYRMVSAKSLVAMHFPVKITKFCILKNVPNFYIKVEAKSNWSCQFTLLDWNLPSFSTIIYAVLGIQNMFFFVFDAEGRRKVEQLRFHI